LCLTELERHAHELVADCMKAASMQVSPDAFGNTVGTRPGRHSGAAIGMGSHVDSVPCGGNFDGVAAVLTALEVMRAINDAGVSLELPEPVGQARLGGRGVEYDLRAAEPEFAPALGEVPSWRLIIVSLSPVQATCVTAARSMVTGGLPAQMVSRGRPSGGNGAFGDVCQR
jgi:hypothetical protein